jgi:Spy/CpxP family protein refolding chaperone
MMGKDKFWIVLSVLVAFAAGLLGGIWSERYFFHKKRDDRIARAQRDSRHFPSLEQMAQELGLSAEQQEQIKKIFERNDVKLKELRSDMHGRLTKIRAELKGALDAVLTPEQRKKFEEMIQNYLLQRKEEYEKRRENSRREDSAEKPKGDMR